MNPLPKIMYDQSQFTSVWMLDVNGIWINDKIYSGMQKISGYAPDQYITYTQNKPISFFFGAYDVKALEEESEVGFDNFTDPKFLKEFNEVSENIYKRTKEISNEYFSKFYKKEKEVLDNDPNVVIEFLKKVHETATHIISYYLLTQPQRFYKFEKQLEPLLPNKDLELISTNGRYLTYVSKMRKAILDTAKKGGSELPTKEIEEFGFLNWGLLGGDLINKESVEKEIKELTSAKKKLDEEVKKMDDLVEAINKRNEILGKKQDKGEKLADIMGHASVLRFDLQTCMLCIVKYADNFIQLAKEKYDLSKEEIASYTFDEILGLIKNGTKQDRKLLEERQKGFLRVYSGGASKTFIGDAAHIEIKDLLEFRQKEIETSSQVKGTIASFPNKENPILRGKAFVITTAFGADDVIKDFKEEEILIATQTHPNIVPQMRMALAIVTDEGGITCHAAIVSRELHKPCIIGTRLATKIFKTGDMVELNLKDGTVRKI